MKVVITGGPCTGKTTTVEALEKRGHKVLPEISRLVIEEQNKIGGDMVPWKRLQDFNAEVTRRQLDMEANAPNGLVFLDRGVIDNLAYCEWGNVTPPQELKDAVTQTSYGKVFLLLPLPFIENDDVRTETGEDVITLTNLIRKAYQEHGHKVIEIPPVSVDERVELILGELKS